MKVFGFTIVRTKLLEEITRETDNVRDDLRVFLKFDGDECYYDTKHFKINEGLKKTILKLARVMDMTDREAGKHYL
jgi:hypothetical protein